MKVDIGDRPTPLVDAILAECERARARGLIWDGRTHEWRKPKRTERRFAKKLNGLFMPVDDLVKEIFRGARVIGPEPTAEQWAEIEAEAKRWNKDADGVYYRVNNDTRERCRHCDARLIEARWPDGRVTVQCHYCGKKKKKD